MTKILKKTPKRIDYFHKQHLSSYNFIDDKNIIHNIYIGDQTVANFKKQCLELEKLISQLRVGGKRVLILTDLKKIGRVNLKTRQMGIKVMRELDVDKAAMFGGNLLVRNLVNIMLVSSGMGYKIKFFDDEKDAREWLLQT